MLLGGLWHGAGWTFVIWGGLHGLYLGINHLFRDFRQRQFDNFAAVDVAAGREANKGILTSVAARMITFGSVLIAWVFFRAPGYSDALKVLRGMFGLSGIQFHSMTYMPNARYVLTLLVACFFWVNFAPNNLEIAKKFKPNWLWLIFMVVVSSLSLLYMNQISEFLYFQF